MANLAPVEPEEEARSSQEGGQVEVKAALDKVRLNLQQVHRFGGDMPWC